MASRIFALDLLGPSAKPGRAWPHFQRSVKRRLTTSASGCASSSWIAISRTSVHLKPMTSASLFRFHHHIAGRRRERDGDAVELTAHAGLAAEARGLRQPEGEIEEGLPFLR